MARMIDAYQAIDIIDEWLDSVGTVMVGKGLSSYGELIGCIEEAPTLTQPNEPLTLVELREMDREPVWVTSARERGNIPSRWVLFAGVSKSKQNSDVFVFMTTGGIAQGYKAVNYGKTWNAYRRPPEGEEET
jgi:hypothetical protein